MILPLPLPKNSPEKLFAYLVLLTEERISTLEKQAAKLKNMLKKTNMPLFPEKFLELPSSLVSQRWLSPPEKQQAEEQTENKSLHALELIFTAKVSNGTVEAAEVSWRAFLAESLENSAIDFYLRLQESNKPASPKKGLLADMDGTLVENETLNDLAHFVGKGDAVSKITRLAMDGKLDFKEALARRVRLLRNTPLQSFLQIESQLRYTPGVKKLFRFLKRKNIATALISGGFKPLTTAVQQELDIDFEFSNNFAIEKGHLTGELVAPIITPQEKKKIVTQFARSCHIDLAQLAYIGDGANDLLAISSVGLGVLYNPGTNLQHNCPHVLRHVKDLRALLYMQGITGFSATPSANNA